MENRKKNQPLDLAVTDPEWTAITTAFAGQEVPAASPLAGKTRLTVQDLHGERLMMIRRGWNGAMDALRDDLAQKHPEIEIVDFDFFNLDAFNRCENANDLMVAIDNWKSVHPLLKVVPVRWKFTIPFGILHAPSPSPTVERFLEAIRQVTGAGEEPPGGR